MFISQIFEKYVAYMCVLLRDGQWWSLYTSSMHHKEAKT